MFSSVNEDLLRLLASRGEMSAQELVAKVARKNNDYTDFYGLAAMLHSGYISTDSTIESEGEKIRGALGIDMPNTAVSLCQLALSKGESFTFNKCLRDSWNDFPVKVFITGAGLLKLEELDQRAEAKCQRHIDYWFAVLLAILAAVAGGFATSYFTPQTQDKTQTTVNAS